VLLSSPNARIPRLGRWWYPEIYYARIPPWYQLNGAFRLGNRPRGTWVGAERRRSDGGVHGKPFAMGEEFFLSLFLVLLVGSRVRCETCLEGGHLLSRDKSVVGIR
jgi:hypothetical protein